MNNNLTNRPFYKVIWEAIRKWQKDHGISDDRLAADLRVSKRTLKEYDKSAHPITLERIGNFFEAENITIFDILPTHSTSVTRDRYFKWEIKPKSDSVPSVNTDTNKNGKERHFNWVRTK